MGPEGFPVGTDMDHDVGGPDHRQGPWCRKEGPTTSETGPTLNRGSTDSSTLVKDLRKEVNTRSRVLGVTSGGWGRVVNRAGRYAWGPEKVGGGTVLQSPYSIRVR